MFKNGNKKLAEKIIDRFAAVEHIKEEVDVDKNTEDRVKVAFLELGYTISAVADTEKEAKAELVNRIYADLENKELILSDSWAEDNLKDK